MKIIKASLKVGIPALAMACAVAFPANAASFAYTISSSSTNAAAGPGQLNPGTFTGSFVYNATLAGFTSVSFDFEGLQSSDLNGLYKVDTSVTANSTNLYIQGITANNSGGQSNENSFLDVQFGAPLGGSSDAISNIHAFAGNPANLTNPPLVAFAVASVPENATWAMMLVGMGVIGFALRRRHNVRVTYA